MQKRHDRGDGLSKLKPEADVDEDAYEGEEHAAERLLAQIRTHFGAHHLGSAHLERVFAEFLDERGSHDGFDALDVARAFLHANQELPLGAEILDDGIAQGKPREGASHVANRLGLFELDLHQRSAGEIDAVVDPLGHQQEKGQHDEHGGNADEELDLADDVE